MAIGQVILRMDQLLVELLAALFENLAVIAVVSVAVDLISGALLVIFAVVTVVAVVVVVVVVVVVDDIGLVAVVVPNMLSTSPLLLLLLLSLLFFWHTSKPEKSLSISRSKVSKLKA